MDIITQAMADAVFYSSIKEVVICLMLIVASVALIFYIFTNEPRVTEELAGFVSVLVLLIGAVITIMIFHSCPGAYDPWGKAAARESAQIIYQDSNGGPRTYKKRPYETRKFSVAEDGSITGSIVIIENKETPEKPK
jgi:hypothetical protein